MRNGLASSAAARGPPQETTAASIAAIANFLFTIPPNGFNGFCGGFSHHGFAAPFTLRARCAPVDCEASSLVLSMACRNAIDWRLAQAIHSRDDICTLAV